MFSYFYPFMQVIFPSLSSIVTIKDCHFTINSIGRLAHTQLIFTLKCLDLI